MDGVMDSRVRPGERPRFRRSDITAVWEFCNSNASAQPSEVARAFASSRRQSVMRYAAAYRWMVAPGRKVGDLPSKPLGYGVTASTIQRLWPMYVEWSQPDQTAKTQPARSAAEGSGLVSPHIAARLAERARLTELIASLPDPDAFLANWSRFNGGGPWLDAGLHIWPGCLIPDTERKVRPGPFGQLYEHLRDDPHWDDFGIVHVPDEKAIELLLAAQAGGSQLPWTVAYEWRYLIPLLRLLHVAREAHQDRIRTICEQMGSAAPILSFPAFVLRPIRDAVRTHLGYGLLPRAQYLPIYKLAGRSESGHRPFEIRYGPDVIARGVDTRSGARDNAVLDAVVSLHRGFRDAIAKDSYPLTLVKMWYLLRARSTEMIQWLNQISAHDLEQGSCSGCAVSHQASVVSMLEGYAWASFDSGSGAGTEDGPGGRTADDQIPDYFNTVVHDKVPAVLELHQETVSLAAGETKKIFEVKVPPGYVAVLEGIGPMPPGVEVEIEADGKKYRF